MGTTAVAVPRPAHLSGRAGVPRRAPKPRGPAPVSPLRTVNLALQGGGAHGAFTWGVLDRLLEDGRVAVEGVSATSAGAMNGACLAYGMAVGGPAAARRALESF